MQVMIESRRDYEMYVKRQVAKLQISNKQKAITRKLMMAGFDDGVSYQANETTYVEVRE